MKDKLVELAEKVEDQESFLVFVRELVKDRESAIKKEKENPSSPTAVPLTRTCLGADNFKTSNWLISWNMALTNNERFMLGWIPPISSRFSPCLGLAFSYQRVTRLHRK